MPTRGENTIAGAFADLVSFIHERTEPTERQQISHQVDLLYIRVLEHIAEIDSANRSADYHKGYSDGYINGVVKSNKY